jgi:hypothetical protein
MAARVARNNDHLLALLLDDVLLRALELAQVDRAGRGVAHFLRALGDAAQELAPNLVVAPEGDDERETLELAIPGDVPNEEVGNTAAITRFFVSLSARAMIRGLWLGGGAGGGGGPCCSSTTGKVRRALAECSSSLDRCTPLA